MKPQFGYVICPVCQHPNVHALEDGRGARHGDWRYIHDICSGSLLQGLQLHAKPLVDRHPACFTAKPVRV